MIRALMLAVLALAVFAPDAAAVYDTATGRWLTRDPAGYVDGGHLYEYCMGNPSSRMDHSGTQSVPISETDDVILPLDTYRTKGKTFDDVIKHIRSVAGKDGCVDKIILDAHNGVPGLLNLPGGWQIRHNDQLDVITRRTHGMFRELCCLICDGGELVVAQCNTGQGPEGAILSNLLSNLCGGRITITTYTGDCTPGGIWPFAMHWDGSKRRIVRGIPVPADEVQKPGDVQDPLYKKHKQKGIKYK